MQLEALKEPIEIHATCPNSDGYAYPGTERLVCPSMSDDAAPSAPMSDTDWTIVSGERVIKEISGATLKLPYKVIHKAESMLHGALEELSRLVAAEDWDLLPHPLEDLEK